MRGFRPSYFQARNEEADDLGLVKEENLQRYIDRVRQGLPLFEEQAMDMPMIVHLAGN